jgi:hypothetical protein
MGQSEQQKRKKVRELLAALPASEIARLQDLFENQEQYNEQLKFQREAVPPVKPSSPPNKAQRRKP